MSVAIPIPLLQHLPDVNVTPAVGVDGYALVYDHDTARFVLRAPAAAPDLSGYALLAGRAGGQTLYGGTAANDDITIHGTSDATRTTSYVLLQPSGGNVGIGTSSPGAALSIAGASLAGTETIPILLLVSPTTVGGFGINSSADNQYCLNVLYQGTPAVASRRFAFGVCGASNQFAVGTVQFDTVIRTYKGKLHVATCSTGDGASSDAVRMTFTQNGLVGIGTASPATALHVVGAATITGGIRPAADSTTALQLQNVAGTSVLNVDTTNARVGIGTTTPEAKLELNNGAVAGEAARLTTTATYGWMNWFEGVVRRGTIGFGDAGQLLNNAIADSFAVSGLTALHLGANDDALKGITITTAGNVGIGDTAPAEALDVTGNINTTGVVKVDDVQVLSNRVIDARCADVANSGDATTDGLIDALRDAMIAHGLIAASA